MQFFNVLLHIDQFLGLVIEQYGTLVYVVLFLIVFCETGLVVFPFLPGDSLLFIAGTFCASGQMHLGLTFLLLALAAISGNTVNYWIGCLLGHRVYSGHYKWINPEAIKKTHAFYEKHGGATLILARFTPIVRTFAPFIAGVSSMTFTRFQLFNSIGAILWVICLLFSGYLFGRIPFVQEHLNTIVLLGVVCAIIPIIALGVWQIIKKVRS